MRKEAKFVTPEEFIAEYAHILLPVMKRLYDK
jgi:hypothetical protein